MQNDEYLYYKVINQFLQFNFVLDPYMGTTFYSQGIVASIFAAIFGLSKLPILTGMLSIATCFILSQVLFKYFNTSQIPALLAGLLLLISPLFLYSTWGFMTENYFMFFLALATYGFYSFWAKKTFKSWTLFNLSAFFAYGTRQFGLLLPLAACIALLYKKNYKWAAVQGAVFILFLFFHFFVFPQTPQMYDGRLLFTNLLDVDAVLTKLYIFGIYTTIFTAPLLISFILNCIKEKPKAMLLLLLVPMLFLFFEKHFEPENILFTLRTQTGSIAYETISPEFPYFGNIFTRKGFYEDNLPGDKYTFPGYFDLFNYLDLAGKLLFVSVLPFLIFFWKKLDKFALAYIVIFAGMLLVSPRLFDRYLLPLVFMVILLLVPLINKTKPVYRGSLLILAAAVFFWGFLGYQFSADNILVNRYIWNESQRLHTELGVPKNKIRPDHSWQQLYPNESKNRDYHFSYADFGNAEENDQYVLLNSYEIKFPLNFYNEAYVYLYFKNTNQKLGY